MKFPIELLDELVAVEYVEDKSPIRLPDWKRSLEGRILAIGPSVKEVAVRDKVTFGAAKGMEAVFSGIPIRLLKEQDLDMVLE
jgi:hypothetical protein